MPTVDEINKEAFRGDTIRNLVDSYVHVARWTFAQPETATSRPSVTFEITAKGGDKNTLRNLNKPESYGTTSGPIYNFCKRAEKHNAKDGFDAYVRYTTNKAETNSYYSFTDT